MAGSTFSCIKRRIGLSAALQIVLTATALAQPQTLPSVPIAPPHARIGAPDYVTTMRNRQGAEVVVGKGFNASQLAGTAPVGPGPTEGDIAPPARHFVQGPVGRPHTPTPITMQRISGDLIPSASARSNKRSEGLNAFRTNAPLTPQQQALERELTAKFRPYRQLTPQDILKPTFRNPQQRKSP